MTEDDGSYNDWYPSLHKWGTFYVTGNVVEGHDDVTADNWTKGIYAQQENGSKVDNLWTEETMKAIRKESPVVDPVMTTEHSAQEAYQAVLNYAEPAIIGMQSTSLSFRMSKKEKLRVRLQEMSLDTSTNLKMYCRHCPNWVTILIRNLRKIPRVM